jgi:large subunit ribosomal protein L7e
METETPQELAGNGNEPEVPVVEAEATEKRLTIDMGPEQLDRVQEHLLKKRKKYQGLKRKEKEAARLQNTHKQTPTIQFKRAEHFLRAAKRSSRDNLRVERNLRKLATRTHLKSMVPKENVKLIAVLRIRTADGIGKLAITAMRKLRVLKMYQCSFIKYDEKTHRLLKTAEPYITWGPPDVRTIRELLTKRGYAQVDVSTSSHVTHSHCTTTDT